MPTLREGVSDGKHLQVYTKFLFDICCQSKNIARQTGAPDLNGRCRENKGLATIETLKARSHDPFLRIRFFVQTVRFQRRFRFCGENVGTSFVVSSHDPFFRTDKESSIWRQNDHAEFVGAFHLSRRVSDENRACSISIRFFKITDPFDGRPFLMCSHNPFFGTNKNRILKNGSCERALTVAPCNYAVW